MHVESGELVGRIRRMSLRRMLRSRTYGICKRRHVDEGDCLSKSSRKQEKGKRDGLAYEVCTQTRVGVSSWP